MIQTPGPADIGKLIVPQVAEHEIPLLMDGSRLPMIITRAGARCARIQIHKVTCHAVGNKKIDPPVIIVISKFRCPGPIRGGQSRQVGDFHKSSGSGVAIKHVSTRLSGASEFQEPFVLAHIIQADFASRCCGSSHVRSEKVSMPVIIDVAMVRSHGGPGKIWQRGIRHVSERAVAIVVP